MQYLRLGAAASPGWPDPAVAIGNFDGVHKGHQVLLDAAVARAHAGASTAVVLTFDPHPARILAPERAPLALTTLAQKAELIGKLGVDVMAVLPFTAALGRMEPAAFVRRILASELRARHVVVGTGFRFGHGQSGDVETLEALGRRHGFSVAAIPPAEEGGRRISSSRVREALASGDVVGARGLLARPHFVDGSVGRGDRRGSAIGVPTANLATENEVLPAAGVYAGRCRLADGSWWLAVVNIGARPTFGGATVTIEAHLVDYQGDLYGTRVRLIFEERLREERRFPGPEALVAQIREDLAWARQLLPRRVGDGV